MVQANRPFTTAKCASSIPVQAKPPTASLLVWQLQQEQQGARWKYSATMPRYSNQVLDRVVRQVPPASLPGTSMQPRLLLPAFPATASRHVVNTALTPRRNTKMTNTRNTRNTSHPARLVVRRKKHHGTTANKKAGASPRLAPATSVQPMEAPAPSQRGAPLSLPACCSASSTHR